MLEMTPSSVACVAGFTSPSLSKSMALIGYLSMAFVAVDVASTSDGAEALAEPGTTPPSS